MERTIRKTIALLTIACFLASGSAAAGAKSGIEVKPKGETPAFLEIDIPANLAKVEEIYEAPSKVDPELVIHVQDSHGNYESQLKIKKLLEHLYKKYGFQLLFVEGAVERLDPGLLRLFPDHERNSALADYLAREGELSGVEFYLIDGPPEIQAVGIEQPELYRANYEAFKKVQAGSADAEAFLGLFEQKLETLSSKSLPAETRRLLSEWKKFQNGHRDFLPYVKRLSEDARRYLDTDLRSMFAQAEWPQITRLLVLQAMEPELDRDAALQERKRLVEFLKSIRASAKLVRAVESLEERHIRMSRLEPADERLENLPRYLLERLVGEAGPKGFAFHEYPAFSLYAGFLVLQSELDSKYLFAEINRLFDQILEAAAKGPEEKDLLRLYADGQLLRNLFRLELTRKDWQKVLKDRSAIRPAAMAERLSGWLEKMGVSEPDLPRLATMSNAEGLAKTFDTALDFYNFARQRESVFFYTMRQEMSERKEDKSSLITGGFHTEGVMDMLREKGINYGILTPRMNDQTDRKNYVSAMLQNRPTIFDLATLAFAAKAQPSAALAGQGMNARAEVKIMIDAFLRVLAAYKPGHPNFWDARNAAARFNASAYAEDRRVQLRLTDDGEAYRILIRGRYLKNEKGRVVEIPVERRKEAALLPSRTREAVVPPDARDPAMAPPEPEPVIAAKPVSVRPEIEKEITEPVPPRLAAAGILSRFSGRIFPALGAPEIRGAAGRLRGAGQVFALAGGIVGYDTPELAAEAMLADLAAQAAEPAADEGSTFQMPVLATTNEPGNLILVMNHLPSPAEIRMAGLLLNSPNQRIRFVAELAGGGAAPEELNALMKTESERVKGRLSLAVVQPAALEKTVRAAILEEARKLRGQIARAGMDMSATELQLNHTVVMFGDGIQGFSYEKGGDALPAKVVRARIDRKNVAARIASLLVGSKYASVLLTEAELIRELGRVIDFKVIPPTISENSIMALASKLWQVQQFREYIERMA